MAVYNDVVTAVGLGRFYTNLKAIGLPLHDWATATSYAEGLTVVHGGTLYRCTTAHTSESTFDDTKFEPVSLDVAPGIPITNWATSTSYAVGDIVLQNYNLYQCTTAHTSDASDFSNDSANWEALSGDTITVADNTDIDSLFS